MDTIKFTDLLSPSAILCKGTIFISLLIKLRNVKAFMIMKKKDIAKVINYSNLHTCLFTVQKNDIKTKL